MNKSFIKIWSNPFNKDLAESLSELADVDSMQKFLGDIMTEKEITEIASRLRAARMLSDKQKYQDVIEATKLSSRTVARISKWLKIGYGGYSIVIAKNSNSHIEPVCAD